MVFTKRLREPIVQGRCHLQRPHLWQSPRVKAGGRYPLGTGVVCVTSIREIGLMDITPELARRSGFEGVVGLLKVAKHGPGQTVYLVEFEYQT